MPRPRTPQLKVLDVSPLGSPAAVFPGCGIDASWLAARFSSNRSCTLVTAFRSPATTAPFGATIPESKFPACYFAVIPMRFPPPVRLFGSTTVSRPGSATPGSGAGCFVASSPLRLFPHSSANCYSRSPLPLGKFCLPRDQSVQPLSPSASPPDDIARSPLAPRHRFYC
jgi:hypothetical protein